MTFPTLLSFYKFSGLFHAWEIKTKFWRPQKPCLEQLILFRYKQIHTYGCSRYLGWHTFQRHMTKDWPVICILDALLLAVQKWGKKSVWQNAVCIHNLWPPSEQSATSLGHSFTLVDGGSSFFVSLSLRLKVVAMVMYQMIPSCWSMPYC